MSRDHEQWQTRRRHDSTVGVIIAAAFAAVYIAFRPDWFGIASDTATFWFIRAVALVLVVCAVGCVYRIRKHRKFKAERELGLPPTTKR